MTALTLNEQTWSELTAREVFRLSFCVETCMKKRSYLLGTEESEHLVFIFLWFIFQLLRRFYFIYNQMLKTEALMNNSFFFPTPTLDSSSIACFHLTLVSNSDSDCFISGCNYMFSSPSVYFNFSFFVCNWLHLYYE